MIDPCLWDDSECELFCELPDIIVSLTSDGQHLYAETASGIYQILSDGSYIGVSFGETA